ncbi:MAG TPA: protease pro-enzyme activation domain-containing protein [Acidisarcina sp.]
MTHSNGAVFSAFSRGGALIKAAIGTTLFLAALSAGAAQHQVLFGHIPQATQSSRSIGRLPREIRLNLAIGLPLRNQDLLDLLLKQITDPDSPYYRHYLLPAEFAAEFSPSQRDYHQLIAWAESNHLTVTETYPNRVLLDVSGDVSEIESAFHLNLLNYVHPERGEFFAPDREPSVDLDIALLDVSGMDNFEVPHPMALRSHPLSEAGPYVTGSGPSGYFLGKDFRAAYAPGVTLTGRGQTVGLLEFDGFYSADVTKNFAQAGLPAVPTQTVLLDGFNGAPGGSNIEVTLDIMMAAYMAPGLSQVMVYEGYSPNDILNRMATDNLAQQLSSSWSFGPINATTEQIFKQYIAQGQSLLQASGDSGAYKGPIMAPSDDPNLTVVGGTSLTTSGAGGAWQSEMAWTGSGGGISTVYPIPAYQQVGNMNSNLAASGGSTKMRNIPDVALTADIQMFLIQNNGQAVVVGGTSAAAPLWAGFIALANQQAAASAKPRVGFLNPALYTIGSGGSYSADFNDITRGNNSGFSAGTAYDLVTGWGSPAGQHLINDLTSVPAAASFSLAASPMTLSLTPGTAASTTITIAPVNGFTGAVTFSAAGLPTGVTASFSTPHAAKTTSHTAQTAQASQSSVLTLTAGSSPLPGTYPVTITGVSGNLSVSTAMSAVVSVPSFGLSSPVNVLTLPGGGTAATSVSITPQGGFTGAVSLSATGLPLGVAATFSPASATTSTSITFAASSNATAGTYPVVLNGVSGSLKSSETISLTITVPGITLSLTPVNLSLPRGFTASTTLAIKPQGGFNGMVSLAATGLPTGVTASFGTLSGSPTTGGLSLVTFTAAGSAPIGTFSVSLTGTSAAMKSSTAATLSVLAPSAGSAFVNLASAYDVSALVIDGAPFTGAGLDGGLNGSSTAYSANLVGMQQSIAGTSFYFGPASAPDAVSSRAVLLPSGQFGSLRLLASGVNGNQVAQVFSVTYTDGTISTYMQSMSDWLSPQNYTGETKAVTMPYRDNGAGQRDNRTFYLYEYSLALNPAKKVSSITFPNNRNVVVLAATLGTASGQSH